MPRRHRRYSSQSRSRGPASTIPLPRPPPRRTVFQDSSEEDNHNRGGRRASRRHSPDAGGATTQPLARPPPRRTVFQDSSEEEGRDRGRRGPSRKRAPGARGSTTIPLPRPPPRRTVFRDSSSEGPSSLAGCGRSRSRTRSGSRSRHQGYRETSYSTSQSAANYRRGAEENRQPRQRDDGRGRSTSARAGSSSLRQDTSAFPRSQSPDRGGARTSVYWDNNLPPTRPRSPLHGANMPPPRQDVKPKYKSYVGEATKAACPGGDTRFSPPGGLQTRPLNLIIDDGEERSYIYYHLIYQNAASQALEWLQSREIAAAEAMSLLPAETVPTIAIMNALNNKKLEPISEGPRGKIWLLDHEHLHVWECMKIMTEERGAVRLMSGWETFDALGSCLKENFGDMLLISWKFEGELREPRE